MNQTAIFWPMLAHVVLVYIVYVVLGIRRRDVVVTGKAKAQAYKQRATEPEGSMNTANNLMNQFEAPVLFHICCLALHATAGVGYFILALAWLFALSRYLHAYVHLTTNKLKHRNYAFRFGLAVLALMWIWLALHLAGVV
ncbi:MAG: MAPEG family protein [Rhizobiaceae bacterium]